MPTYDYRCPNGHDFEHFFRKISDATPEFACPQCGAVAERRVSGGAGLVFKGSGFYLTDYGKNAHRKSGGGGDSGGGESKSASSGDSAPPKTESSKSDGASSKSDGASGASAKSESTKSEAKPAPKPKGDAS